jgi:hypothetical protein
MQVWRTVSYMQNVGESSSGSKHVQTVISTGEKVAQGAAKKKKIIEELLGG